MRVVYNAVGADGGQLAHSFVVTLRSTNSYGQAEMQSSVTLEKTWVGITPGTHILLPELIGTDGLGGSDAVLDTPMIVRYKVVFDDASYLVKDVAVPMYSGLVGPQLVVGQSTLTGASGGTCPGTQNSSGIYSSPCNSGDYEYGSFCEKTASTGALKFFTPYSGEGSTGGWTVHGGTVDVTP